MIQKIRNFILRKQLVKKVENLQIVDSGNDEEGDSFVKLSDGTIFYGNKTSGKFDKFHYKSLSTATKNTLKFDALQVALDIIIRYVEGGLQYLGPKKQSRYNVSSGDYVSEMGAYQGFCSVKLAKQVGKAGRVVCIEPMPDNFRLLKKNMEANSLSQVICINMGVWDEEIELKFNRRKGDGQSSSAEITYNESEAYNIKGAPLDSIFSEIGIQATDFMIIQLNGAEINALRGLTNFKPKNLSIAARYDTEGVDAALAIQDILVKRGYHVAIEEQDFVFASLL